MVPDYEFRWESGNDPQSPADIRELEEASFILADAGK